jgi:hypothetical protein
MQRTAPWILAATLAAMALPPAAQAGEWALDVTLGRSHQRDDESRLFAAGLNVAYVQPGWWVHPEIGQETRSGFWSGDDREVTAGLRSEWPLGNGRIWLGGGYARLSMDWGANRGHSNGWYARLGAMWPVGLRGFHMGVEGKASRGDDYHPWGVPTPTGANRIGLLLAWRI